MDSKFKVIILLFVLIVVMYLISYIIKYMNDTKKKEAFEEEEDDQEDFTEQETTSESSSVKKEKKDTLASETTDPRVIIMDTVEKFVENKEQRLKYISELFNNIETYKDLSKATIVAKVEKYINSENEVGVSDKTLLESEKKNERFENAPATTTTTAEKSTTAPKQDDNMKKISESVNTLNNELTSMTSHIDALYSQFGNIKNNVQTLSSLTGTQKATAAPKAQTQTQSIEHFIDGFENVSSFASYDSLL